MTKSETLSKLAIGIDGATGISSSSLRSDFAPRNSSVSLETPPVSRALLRLFTWYSRRYMARHFNSLRVSGAGLSPEVLTKPLVIYSNHASWWDPLVGLLLAREFLPDKTVYAPMDAAALERYKFFKKLGMFGVEQGTRRGAAEFLRKADAILKSSDNALWLTPQSRFADVRERPVQFKSGIGHLPGRAAQASYVPVAIEYTYWEERFPEILVGFGQAIEVRGDDLNLDPRHWTEFFAAQLADTQDALTEHALCRDPQMFRCIVRGKSGVGGIYDSWRSIRARWRGEKFKPQHGHI